MARPRNRRLRKIWLSVAWTVGGLVVITAAGFWLDRARNTDLQNPTEGVTTAFLHEVPAEAPILAFSDVASELGIEAILGPGGRGRTLPEDTGSGLAWGDYDGDGDDDLYLPGFGGALGVAPDPMGMNRLYRNDGGAFVDVTREAGVGDLDGFAMGAFFADIDADDDLDLYVTNFGANRLFRNRGDGRFEEVATELGLADELWSIAAAFADYDRDGRLDLYVTNYVDYDATSAVAVSAPADPNWEGVPYTLNPNAFDPVPNRLFHQRQDGTFEDLALELGASNERGRSLAAAFVDLDGDGWLDLYVANDVSPNVLLRNRAAEIGDALFEDVSSQTGTADPRGSMGVSIADLAFDETGLDGRPDLLVTHWVAQENALYQAIDVGGRLEYRDRARNMRLAEISTDRVGWGSAFADLDLDGRLDLLVANGSTLEEDPSRLQAQAPFFFWNGGDRFYDAVSAWGQGLDTQIVARGLAVSDFDVDGDPDVAIAINRDRPLLLENAGDPRGAWLGVRLAAPASITAGARVTVESDSTLTTRWVGADVSFASMHSAELIFGLGEDRSATVEIAFADGRRIRLTRQFAGNRLVVGRT